MPTTELWVIQYIQTRNEVLQLLPLVHQRHTGWFLGLAGYKMSLSVTFRQKTPEHNRIKISKPFTCAISSRPTPQTSFQTAGEKQPNGNIICSKWSNFQHVWGMSCLSTDQFGPNPSEKKIHRNVGNDGVHLCVHWAVRRHQLATSGHIDSTQVIHRSFGSVWCFVIRPTSG